MRGSCGPLLTYIISNWWYFVSVPRLGKKTLYLDLDALDRLDAALKRLPGRPSVSSYLSEVLPSHARQIELMVESMETGGVRGLAKMFGSLTEELTVLDQTVKDAVKEAESKGKADMKLSELAKDVPPQKPRRTVAKKVVKT